MRIKEKYILEKYKELDKVISILNIEVENECELKDYYYHNFKKKRKKRKEYKEMLDQYNIL